MERPPKRALLACRNLVVIPTGVIAVPPVGVAGDDRLATEPIAFVGGIVIRTVGPDPYAIPEDPMALELVVVAVNVLAFPSVTGLLAFPIVLPFPIVTGLLAFPIVLPFPSVTGLLAFPILTADGAVYTPLTREVASRTATLVAGTAIRTIAQRGATAATAAIISISTTTAAMASASSAAIASAPSANRGRSAAVTTTSAVASA